MAKKTTLDEVGEMLTHVVKHMVTKDDIKDMVTKDDVREIVNEIVDEKVNEIVGERLKPLEAKIDGVDSKLGGFENREVDKRLQLTVRVGAIETHLDLKPPVGTVSQ